ncbi:MULTISPECIES: ROK family protein [Geobacillus]|uniref:ROK family protein n=1 Tax=Geobacillus TaxID=129337 RepID=UPI000358BA0B|nr:MULTISPECIES: ROK family protein [Geobacillus]EPR28962.1 Glucokinase [Geobacillus sp. WSUCF1]OQP18254.1 transcriptional regulator [Geobacillus zalihae]
MRYYIVFDIGGTYVKHAVMNEHGDFFEKGRYRSERHDFHQFRDDLLNVVRQAQANYPLSGIAISSAGSVDSDIGVIGGSSALPCIHGPNFKDVFGGATGLPVEMENDANCAALGELWKGAGRGCRDIAFVIVGTGIGGAIVKDGRIHKGAHLHGGEFGYMLMDVRYENGRIECKTWSELAATSALIRMAAEEKGMPERELDGEKVFALAKGGDEAAQKAIDRFYFSLAQGIFNLQYAYDPEKIIVGGGISSRSDFISEINKRLSALLSVVSIAKVRPVVEACRFKNDANLLGALYHYLERRGELGAGLFPPAD